ncbi:MAG: protoporphyrinogen oxidase, partial [Ignavibacteria bacterium]|nr:protoporphyrinogen oxidase [Ignavibacteria bacterium]
MKKKVTILGAGISGLATAYWLQKDGYDVYVIEQKGEAGGTMETFFQEKFLIDYGPNSGLETTPLIRKLADEIGIADEMIYANESSNKRYILKHDELHPLPTSPRAFLKTKLFSTKAKFRVIAEPFIGKSNDGYYQSIAQFVKRRLGQEFLDYAIDPFVSGVFAGDPEKLSVKSAFPKLYRLEEIYGGLVKGMIKGARERKKRAEQSKQNAKMFSFKSGMQSFPKAIEQKMNNKIYFNCSVTNVKRNDFGWIIEYQKDNNTFDMNSDIVISTLPVDSAATVFYNLDKEFQKHSSEIYYPPVMVLYLGFKKKDIGQTLDGFGFLIPSKEKRSFLGAIWNSVIFPNRCDENMAAFTLFIGGARTPNLFEIEKEKLFNQVIHEFKSIMKI